MTVFVGPNNSGKSRALQEIENWIKSPNPSTGLVIKSIEFEAWTHAGIEKAVNELKIEPALNEALNPDHILISKLHPQNNSPVRMQIHEPSLIQEAQEPNATRHRYAPFLSLFSLKLDGTNRRRWLTPRSPEISSALLQIILRTFLLITPHAQHSEKLRDAFGKYLVVDPTNIGELRFRLSHRAPVDVVETLEPITDASELRPS